MYDPAICRQVFNVGISVTSLKNRDLQFKRSARRSKERIKKYVKEKELGLALIEAETAAQKLEMAEKYRAVAEKLHFISKEFAKAEANNSFDDELKMMIKLVDTAVRSMDIEKMEKTMEIYEKYFQGKEESEKGGGDGGSKGEKVEMAEAGRSKSKAEELLEEVIREVSKKDSGASQPVVVPALAMNLAKKERPVVEDVLRQLEDKEEPHIDTVASNLMKKSSLFLPEFDI